MCKAIKEKFKRDHFSFNPFTEKEVINFISKLPTNKPSVPNDTLVFISKTATSSLLLKAYQYYERLFKKQNVSW